MTRATRPAPDAITMSRTSERSTLDQSGAYRIAPTRTDPESNTAGQKPAKLAVSQPTPMAASSLAFKNPPRPAGLTVDDPVPAANPALKVGVTGGRVRPCLVTVTGHGMHSPSNADVIAIVLGMPLVDKANSVEAAQ